MRFQARVEIRVMVSGTVWIKDPCFDAIAYAFITLCVITVGHRQKDIVVCKRKIRLERQAVQEYQ